MRRAIVIGLAASLALPCGTASAQYSSYNMPNPMAAWAATMNNNVIMSAPLYQQMDIMNKKARAQGATQANPPPSPQHTSLAFDPGNGAQAVARYVANISSRDRPAGNQVRAALDGKNVPAIFSQLVSPFGLTDHDVADAIAAHLIMRTLVVTGAPPPSPQGVRNVRNAVARAISNDPKMASQAYRQQVGGEAQLDFVLVNATWRAMADGKWSADAAQKYRQGLSTGLAREGVDLRTMQLTGNGFVAK